MQCGHSGLQNMTMTMSFLWTLSLKSTSVRSMILLVFLSPCVDRFLLKIDMMTAYDSIQNDKKFCHNSSSNHGEIVLIAGVALRSDLRGTKKSS
jgi:hypothetical protein